MAVIRSADLPPYELAIEGLLEALKKERPEATIAEFSLEGQEARWKDVEAQVRKRNPDAVVPVGSLALTLSQKGFRDRPVVFTMVLNPEKLIAPGAANVTGVSMNHSAADQVARLREGFPQARRVAVLYNPAESGPALGELRAAGDRAGLAIVPLEVKAAADLPAALRELPGKADVLWLLADRTVVGTPEALELISLESLQARIPVAGPSERFTKAGAVLSLSVDYRDLGVQTGALLGEILGGRKPSERPPQNARRIVVTVNRKVASALGVEFPEAFLKGAAEAGR